MAARAPQRAPRKYRVYVIELSRDCVLNPGDLPPLYVGQTAHSPEHRFAQHKAGGRLAGRKPHRYGLRLRWDFMAGIGPFTTRQEAEKAERVVATVLKKRGHRVFWG